MNLFTCLRQAVVYIKTPFLRRFSKRNHLRFLSNFLSVVVDSFSDVGNSKDGYSSIAMSFMSESALPRKSSIRSWVVTTAMMLCTVAGAIAQLPNVTVQKTLSNVSPNLGEDILYTISVTNTSSVAATGVELTDVLPTNVSYITYSTASGVYSNATGVWSIGTVPANTTLTLTIAAKVQLGDAGRGLAFSVSEITKQNEANADGSVPGNGDFQEDDIDAVCFSIPLYFYQGDEYKIIPPLGYTNVVWSKKVGLSGVEAPVTASTPGVRISGDTLILDGGITDYTEFTFTASQKNCPASACCPVKVVPGPYGSIGNYVWFDTNQDGKQDASETGVDGIRVYLYASDGVTKLDSTVTSGGGKYLFSSLFSGTYYVKFVPNAGNKLTSYKQGADDAVDSDADPISGLSPPVIIDVDGIGKAKDNMDIDAGLVPNTCTTPQTVSINSVAPICPGSTITLTAAGTNVSTYNWTTTGTGSFSNATGITTTYTPSSSDIAAGSVNFTVTTDDPDGQSPLCSAVSSTIAVTIKPTPVIAVSGGGAICNGATAVLTASVPTGSAIPDKINWYEGTATTPFATTTFTNLTSQTVVSPTTSKTYYAEAELSGCTSVKQVLNVTVTNAPFLADSAFVACASTPVELTIGHSSKNFSSLQWYSHQTGQTVGTPIVGATGTYFTPTISEFPTTAGDHYYAVIANNNGCADTAFVKLTVKEILTVNIYTGAGTICLGQSAALVAHSPNASKIYWYTGSSTLPFAITNNDEALNVTPAITETYYAEVREGGCVSARSSAIVVVAPKAPAPTVKDLANVCPATTVNLADAILSQPSAGGTFEWHVSNSPTSALVSGTTSIGAGRYYLFEKTAAGCYCDPSVVTVTINNCQCPNPASVSVGTLASICKIVPVNLIATLGGGATSGTWSTTGTGTFSSTTSPTATYTPSATDLTKTSIEFTFTTNDPDGTGTLCNAVSGTQILVIKANPIIPITLKCDTEICLGESNKLFAVSPGNTVYWYDSMTGTALAQADENGFVVTPTTEGSYTYYAKAFTPDGCESTFSSVTFNVTKCLTDLTVTKDILTIPDALTSPSYLLGQKITYSIVAENIGTITANSVKVTDILPSSLTYVSSTPAGQYNASTGEWTIGTLNGGSSKVLLIEATVNAIGSIHNEAVISSPEEDPTKLTNNKSYKDIVAVDVADLSLTKTVNNKVPVLGSEVEYTITVSNAGPNTATNVRVKDVLPAGLEFVSSSTLTNSLGVLTATVPSIAKNASVSFTFKAKVTQTGAIVNKAEVTNSDQRDPDSTPGNGTTTDEDDDDNVEIQVKEECNLVAPVIACGVRDVCYGESITITAAGCVGQTVVWNTGARGTTLVTSPLTSTTFTAYCEQGSCRSAVSNAIAINVTKLSAPSLAGPSQVCAGSPVMLTASACDGTVQWQTSPTETGSTITVNPVVTTTYYATCKVYGCTSPVGSVTVKVVPVPDAPEVICNTMNICPGQSTYLTAMNCNGQVTWNTGQTTTIITVSPLVTTSYTATCTEDGCTSAVSAPHEIVVTPIAAPTIASSATTICTGTSVQLSASNCSGKVTWNIGGGQTMTGTSITVKPSVTTTYSATCSSIYCTSEKSTDLTVTVANPAVPTLTSAVSSICAGASVDITASACAGDVIWSNGATGNKITVNPTVTTSYTAICKVGTCQSAASDKLTITVTEFAKPSIYTDNLSVCAGSSITLTSNGCNGTVVWSDGQKGSAIVITPTADIKYTAICQSTTCKSDKSNELAIVVTPLPTAPVISCPVTTLCAGASTTLTATGCSAGTIKWSNGSTGATLVVTPTATTTYTAKCIAAGCESTVSNEKTITVNPAVTPTLSIVADSPTICAGSSTTLTLKGCEAGTITWNNNLPSGAIVTVSPTVTTTYSVVCSGVACAKDVSISTTVTVTPPATTPTIVVAGMPTATSEVQVCPSAEVTLNASGCNGTVLWSTGETTSSIKVMPTVQTSYTVKCVAAAGTCSSQAVSAPLVVKVGAPARPVITSSTSSNTGVLTCSGGQVTLTASGCGTATVVWSNGKTGASIVETINSTTSYTAVCKQDLCSSEISEKITVTVTVPSVPTITCASNTICAGSKVSLVAVGCEGTVKWSDGFVGTINDVSPSQTTDYTATCTVGQCESSLSAVATVNVGTPSAPVISCNATAICSGIQITLAANNCAGTVIWSDGQVGSVITASPKVTTAYTAICKLDKCQSGLSNKVTVSVSTALATPTTKDLVNVCPFKTVDLTAGVLSTLSASGNVFEFHTGNTITSPLVASPNMVALTGTYYVFEKTGTGCYSTGAPINVFINTNCSNIDCVANPATVNAGADVTLCAEKLVNLNATMGGAATSLTWKTTGSGTFDNPLSPTAIYRSSLQDVLAGSVKLIVSTNDPDGTGSCKAATDTILVTINGVKFKPTIAVDGNLNACGTDSVKLTAVAGYEYQWYKVGTSTVFATTQTVTIKGSNGGRYYYKLIDKNRCCSIESDTATINPLAALDAPVVISSSKINKGQTINLTNLVSSSIPSGATLVFKVGNTTASNTVANPSAVGAGTYYAYYKSAQGCYSVGSKIVVEYNDGVVDAADVLVTITTDKSTYAAGDTVTTTITVKNIGNLTAKEIKVSSQLPSNLTYLSQTGGLTNTGGILSASLDSLVKQGAKVYTYKAIVATKGQTTIPATVTATNDNTPDNNTASAVINSGTVDPKAADLALVITSDKASVEVGGTVTISMKLTNNGPATAKSISLKNTLPAGLTFVSSTSGLTAADGAILLSLDSMITSEKVYTYVAKVTQVGDLSNTALVSSANDPNTANNGSIVVIKGVEVSGTADIEVDLTATKQVVSKDDEITFTISVKNNGPKEASDVVVKNLLPKNLTYVSANDGLGKSGDTLLITIPSIANGATKVYTYVVKVAKDTIIRNTVAVTKSTPVDPITTNNSKTVILVPVSATDYADLAVIMTSSKSTVANGDAVTFFVKLTNNGGGDVTNVVLKNYLPSNFEFVSSSDFSLGTGDTLRSSVIPALAKGTSATYTYIAKAKVVGNVSNTVSIAKSDKADLITGNNSSTVLVTITDNYVCKLGLAMKVVDTVKVSTGVYNITYRLLAKNFCTDTLKNVTLTDTLANNFKSPATYELVGTPTLGKGSLLAVNPSFGATDPHIVQTAGGILLPGATDTVTYVVKVTLNGVKSFTSQAQVTGMNGTTKLTALSSDGVDVNATPSKTTVRFDLPQSLLGVAKELVSKTKVSANVWTVTYNIKVVNMGTNAISKVSVKDNLDSVFTIKGATVTSVAKSIASGSTLKINTNYTGAGLQTELLDTTSTLAQGESGVIQLVVGVNTSVAPDSVFSNVAIGSGIGSDKKSVRDVSTEGTNPDSDGDKDPTNNNVATSVTLDAKPAAKGAVIGLALSANTPVPNADSSVYNVTYTVRAVNIGTVDLKNVNITNDLQAMIGSDVTAWSIVGKPTLVKGSATIDTLFARSATQLSMTKAAGTTLAKGDSIVISYQVKITSPLKSIINNQANVAAISVLDTTINVSDISTNGTKVDPNDDGNPIEQDATPINVKASTSTGNITIPQGFSPNGDGQNDTFVITGVNKDTEQVELQIFNRWGSLVYASEDYSNTWDGKANQGVKIIGDGLSLPDGTYFYVVTIKDRTTKTITSTKARYLTLMR